MHVPARGNLARLDGELQCITRVARLRIPGQMTGRESKSAGKNGGGSLIRDGQTIPSSERLYVHTSLVPLLPCPRLDSMVLPPVLPGVLFTHRCSGSSLSVLGGKGLL